MQTHTERYKHKRIERHGVYTEPNTHTHIHTETCTYIQYIQPDRQSYNIYIQRETGEQTDTNAQRQTEDTYTRYMHIETESFIHTNMPSFTDEHTYVHAGRMADTYIHTYIHTYTYIHAYGHADTYTHADIQTG